MSYHIVQRIELNKDEKRVYITGSDNNVYPRTPSRWHCSYYDKMAQAEDWEGIDLNILDAYQSGSFQAGRQNKYTRALEALRKMPEYHKFDWRNNNWDEYKKNTEELKDEYNDLLKKAFKIKLPKEKYIITKEYGLKKVFLYHRKNAHSCKWYYEYDKNKATKFNFKEDAEALKKCFTRSEDWKIELINI